MPSNGLNSRTVFVIVPETGKPEVREPAWSGSCKAPLLGLLLVMWCPGGTENREEVSSPKSDPTHEGSILMI